jgi:hypothetical protein
MRYICIMRASNAYSCRPLALHIFSLGIVALSKYYLNIFDNGTAMHLRARKSLVGNPRVRDIQPGRLDAPPMRR